LAARANEQILTVAVFDFESKDEAVKDLGPKIATLVNVKLSIEHNIITVERAELEKALGEQELGLSGTVSADTAAKVGHLTGAKVLVTGRAFKVEKRTCHRRENYQHRNEPCFRRNGHGRCIRFPH
jgi:hypothetical protein